MYNNFYAIVQPEGGWGVLLGFDMGDDDRMRRVNGRLEKQKNDLWYTPVVIVRYAATDRLRLAARAEYYGDRYGIITGITSSPQTPDGFQTFGYSLNFDYTVTPQALFRVEGKVYSSRDAIFESGRRSANTTPSRTNASLTAGLAVAF